MIDEELLDAARTVRELAYCPYSDFRVGAAIIDENSNVHVGCNVENAAYPQGSCAEAGAISAMVAAGWSAHRHHRGCRWWLRQNPGMHTVRRLPATHSRVLGR